MEHDHQSSKAEGKATGTRGRKNATSYLSSDARAVFDLQQAAGNRAEAIDDRTIKNRIGKHLERQIDRTSIVDRRMFRYARHRMPTRLAQLASTSSTGFPPTARRQARRVRSSAGA